ncbi:hypothetical protein A0128_21175 [Leptospira tipperaryensis]|uniref:Cobalt transporter n=1 Tax=Leptospira tipperaryensis TaxID=2564040 RepID=A0A1D7V3Z8_9LEPT|nr:CbtA family protein [Leptospira tipperaryensis]AOP36523.1 hypothetical protein A0128_21175 [Leptospira tipperaryensis]
MKEIFLKRLVLGCKAGLIAGLGYGILLQVLVTPLILKAESFETKSSENSGHVHSHEHGTKEHPRSANPSEESNTFSPKRFVWTWVGAILLGLAFGSLATIGFSLLEFSQLLSPEFLRTRWKSSFTISILGFLIFFGIPSLGLPPQLPGIVGSEEDFGLRQNWWFGAVLGSTTTLIGIFTFFKLLNKSPIAANVLSLLLLILFLFYLFVIPGIPEHSTKSLAPESLRLQFILTSLATNILLWLGIGFLVSHFILNQKTEPETI